jgi:hypothetical protein
MSSHLQSTAFSCAAMSRGCFLNSETRSCWMSALMSSLLVAALLCVAGCGGASTSSTPAAPVGSITFSAPATGSTVKSLPVTVTLALSNVTTLTNAQVTLNGADITSDFTVSGQAATATVSVDAYLGSNRLKATIGSNVNDATFTYDPSNTPSGGTPPGGSSTTLTDVIPLQTRVVMINSSGQPIWGIQIGPTAYPQPDAATDGFQVLVLKRTDLSLISNTDYPMTSAQSALALNLGVAPYAANYTNLCGVSGCLVLVQSLNTIGVQPCSVFSNYDPAQCGLYSSLFGSLGATGLISSASMNDSANIGYSLIANVTTAGLKSASSYERITCDNSDGCVGQSGPSPTMVLDGISPNGLDGTLPTLANTGSTGTTSIPVSAYTPAMTVSNNGAIGGALVIDNCNDYTYSPSDPSIVFQMGTVQNSSTPKHIVILDYPAGSSFVFPNGQSEMAGESAQLPVGAKGGFHLVAWDATTWQNVANSTYVIDPTLCRVPSCTSPDGTTIYPLQNLITDLTALNSRRYILFLGSIGTLDHNMNDPNDPGSHQATMQDVWDRVAQSVQDVGGTYSLFAGLNYPGFVNNPYDQYTPNTVPEDDYNMVGQWWLNDTTLPNPLAIEASTAIHRETMKYPVPGNLVGVLDKERDGYYRAKLESSHSGFVNLGSLALASAPTQQPIAWTLTSAADSNAQKAAYIWISNQLLNCVNECGDIRAAYPNLNQSPELWLTNLSSLMMPQDCANQSSTSCPLGFGQPEFDAAKTQLLTEITYVGLVRQYENNYLGLLQSEQANISLILQQVSDEVLGNIQYVTSSTTSGGSWKTDVEDGFKIAGPLIGIAGSAFPEEGGPVVAGTVNSIFGVIDFGLDQSATRTNDPNGRSLQEQATDLIAVSALAGQKANQYASTLTTLGVDFKRILSDWGRLKAVALPIQNNQLIWDPQVAGATLNDFDSTLRRSFYKQLMPVSYNVTHYRYALPGTPGVYDDVNFRPGSPQCAFYEGLPGLQQNNPDSYGFFPGALIDGPGSPVSHSVSFGNLYPFDLWWDVWILQNKAAKSDCPTNSNNQATEILPAAFYQATGLFRPLDPADSTPMGFYKPTFYMQSGFYINQQVSTDTTFWEDNGISGGQPYVRGMSDWNPDPDNY